MGLLSGFPTYKNGIDYNVSLSFPGMPSIISKGKETNLLIPNSDYLVKFVNGDIGISDSMTKSMIDKNINSPISSSNEMVFRQFLDSNKLDSSDLSKYESGGKYKLPKSEINLSNENDLFGLKALEVTTLKSIFETQKPYMEIAQIVVGTLAKLEDITARIMPLIGVPLKTKSKKPIGNPDAIGYKGGEKLKDELSKIKSLSRKGGESKFDENGNLIRDNKKINNYSNSDDPKDWKIISEIYSTGTFDPNVEYTYTYIDLPRDNDDKKLLSDLDLNPEDPYDKYKPETIILGIFDSKGNPINPNSKIKTLDGNGNVVDSEFKRAEWLLNSPKWKFAPGEYTWSSFGNAITKKDKDGNTKYYKNKEKNIITGEESIPGTPIITGFNPIDKSEYIEYFTNLIDIKMLGIDSITQLERNKISNNIISQLDIDSHLENVFVWGQNKSSVYRKIGIPNSYLLKNGLTTQSDPFPGAQSKTSNSFMKSSFKPMKIKSNEALSDEKLLEYVRYKGRPDSDAGWIWIDPNSDYLTKVIRVDPTTKIKYKYAEGEPEVSATIKSFVKNVIIFKISDNRKFNIEIKRNIGDGKYVFYDSANNIDSYELENWNYLDNGIISEFGKINEEPKINNANSYKVNIWGDEPTKYYNTGANFFRNVSKYDGYDLVEEVSKDTKWKLFIYKVDEFGQNTEVTTDGYQKLNDGSLVEVVDGIITKWYYMTPNNDSMDYKNGEWDVDLPKNGEKMVVTIDSNSIGIDNKESIVFSNIPQYQIKVKGDDSKGNIIDPSKVLNNHLSLAEPYSNGKYGHGSDDNPQDIGVIKRHMLTELDTESYYIIEGILPSKYKPGSDGSSGVDESGYYKLPDALGATKVFLSILGDIFGELIPTISKLIELFKNPASLLTSIITEKMKDGFGFISEDAIKDFIKGNNLKSGLSSVDKSNEREFSKYVRSIEDFFKGSSLSNIVYVNPSGDFNSVLDGVSNISFDIFGKSIGLGMELDMGKIPGSPLGMSSGSNVDKKEQPILKMLLGIVTLPMKIIGGIIEWLMDFFKKLSNPIKLPGLLTEFLSFSWIMDFFTPKGLMDMLGIEFDPSKIAEWISLSKLDSISDNHDIADLNEFLSVSFGFELPTYTKEQFKGMLPNMPLNLLKSLFCFIENIINGIIDFIWSTLGIEAVIKPPHIKLCNDDDSLDDISNSINGDKDDTDRINSNLGDGFMYEIELPNGDIKGFFSKEEVDIFMLSNKNFNYNINY